jgi:hypothetical protein
VAKLKDFWRGDAKVTVNSASDVRWHDVIVYDGSGPEFGYEVASYRDRKKALIHARAIREAMRLRVRV